MSVYFGIFKDAKTFDDVANGSEAALFSAEARNENMDGDSSLRQEKRLDHRQNASGTLHLKFRSREKAEELFEYHKQEFSGKFDSADAYVKGANEAVMNADVAKVDIDRGDMVFLDKDTCHFAVVSKQYEFRTFIKPRDCIGYFDHQRGEQVDPNKLRNGFPKWAFAEKYAGARQSSDASNGSHRGADNSSNNPLNIPNYEFTSEASAKSHFTKHGREFGGAYSNWQEYVRGANSAIARSTRNKTRSGGDKLYLVDESCEFVVLASFGKIRTYFRPNDCIRYFERQ